MKKSFLRNCFVDVEHGDNVSEMVSYHNQSPQPVNYYINMAIILLFMYFCGRRAESGNYTYNIHWGWKIHLYDKSRGGDGISIYKKGIYSVYHYNSI